MATQYPRYQMKDTQTRLGQEYFNPIWLDLDSRLDKLEQLKLDWNTAISEIQQFGLDRIDATVVPVLAAAQVELAAAQAQVIELQQMIAAADIQGQIDAALAEITALALAGL
ncbi:hypothetical protein COW20_15330 [bacterium (Candidatus Blackallbacteria) CG13_big_fil_rev_8_21_14_2_50_49_14]|nr:MAG: hypothetical protein COW64_15170 [bacterium (Candidatus Blackallbacteria) CG18_big_fil_WC_8_21_14_2_50_49_26]PIW46659.1 MAG: hypothetical protein COW20_15330 [bacterium (Candidatus Blackallbacteria) CG13_big_fil_rev_8_21_14_2_50_49_14]